MNFNESRKNNAEGEARKPLYTLAVTSLIAAFVFAALPLSSAFAAPTGPGGSNDSNDSWSNKVKKLQGEISIAQNMQTQPGMLCASSDQARYRDEYIATLRAAQGLMSRGSSSVVPVTGNSANNSSNTSTSNNGTTANGNNTTSVSGNGNGNYYANHPEKLLADYLHRLRQLREKIASGSDRNGNSNASNTSCTAQVTGSTTGTGTGTGTGSATSTPAPSTTPTATP
jgi:hypothetical protein